MKTTRRKLNEMHEALRELGTRFLPSLDSDLKIGRLLEKIADANGPLSRERNKVVVRLLDEEGGAAAVDKLSNLAKQMFTAKISAEQDALDDLEVEIDIPDSWLVKPDDLPKERAGADDGWKNAIGRGGIRAALGPLFQDLKE